MRARFIWLWVVILVCICVAGLRAASLSDIIQHVKGMKAQGKSHAEIAQYITATVDDHIIAMNRDTPDENEQLSSQQYNMYKEAFDKWSLEGVDVDAPYAAAHWCWQNRIGHCQEHAHIVYHILMLSLESGKDMREFSCGDHAYVIWGVPENCPGKLSISDLNSWDNAYIIDPWLGVYMSTKDVGRSDLTLTKAGFLWIDRIVDRTYKAYKKEYDLWLKKAADFTGKYGAESDKLIVTEVSGATNIKVGQIMNTKPAGVFQVDQTQDNEVTVTFRASKLKGSALGRTVILNDVVSGNVSYAHLTLFKSGSTKKLKVYLKTTNPNTGVVIIREGILTKVQ
jgi:hypothetical protein